MIEQILQNAISSIEAQRVAEIQNAKNVAINEKINPFNNEIDAAYQRAVEELTIKFENEKRTLLEAGNKKKIEHQDKVIKQVVDTISYKYDLSIAKLKKHIEEIGEI